MKKLKDHPTLDFYTLFCKAFEHFNAQLFSNRLPAVIITMQRLNKTMGYFSKDRWSDAKGNTTHEIAINPAYFASHKLIEILQTIVHEQCHLWQEEFGTPSRRTYHNKEWADKMESLGLMPSDTGAPGGKRTGQHMGDYPIPGGAFLQACNSLLKDGFKLNWVDRFPARNPQIYMAGQTGISSASPPDLSAQEADHGAPELHALVSEIVTNIVVADPEAEPQAKRKNKVKYQCECHNNVWGKPELKLRCEECNQLFVEA